MTARAAAPILAAVLGGCMTIYPDPELPDLVATWIPEECAPDGVRVRFEVRDDDDPEALPTTADFDCAAGQGRIRDLPRGQLTATPGLLDASGALVARSTPLHVDLRDGNSRRQWVLGFYRDEGIVRIGWTFPGGQTCESLGTGNMQIDAWSDDPAAGSVGYGTPCVLGALDGAVLTAGAYTVQVTALSDATGMPVATSVRLVDQVIPDKGAYVDLGTVVVTPCAPCDVGSPPPP